MQFLLIEKMNKLDELIAGQIEAHLALPGTLGEPGSEQEDNIQTLSEDLRDLRH